jgi:predicted flap endonuclease-1-like 5' DNA nuclease
VTATTPAHDPDKLRERVAQLESAAASFRTNTQRSNEQLAEATKRAQEQAAKLQQLEQESAAARFRLEADLEVQREKTEAALQTQRAEIDAELAALRERAGSSNTEALAKRLDALAQASESARTMLQGVRVEVDAHSRAFDARKIRIDSIEHELTVLRGDSHLAELKRAMERMDLRMAALEQEVQGLRAQVTEVLPTVSYERDRLRVAEARVAMLDGGKKPSMLPPWFEPPAEKSSAIHELPVEGVAALERIKGVGPRTAQMLFDAGIRTIAEVAAWTDEDLGRIATIVGKKPAQITKAGWVASARSLVAG